MKKIIALLGILVFLSCKEEVVKKPNKLIEKSVMVNIMYDLSLLEAIKYQAQEVLDSNQIAPKQYIYKKYKIDSLQFAKSSVYYAANYEEYKNMFDQVSKRLDKEKARVDALIKAEEKKKRKTKKKEKDAAVKVTPIPTKSISDSLEINQRRRLSK